MDKFYDLIRDCYFRALLWEKYPKSASADGESLIKREKKTSEEK